MIRADLPVPWGTAYANMADNDDNYDAGGMFNDPEGFYEPEKEPTFAEHPMLSGQTVRVRLVGSHPLYVCFPLPSISITMLFAEYLD